ncbi:hypothetical protein NB689_003389 [Xanthomonas sacchari]|nr:hypothetical protein [Xanthomonas sacchari]
MAGGQRRAHRVDLGRIDLPQRRVQAQPGAAVVLALPGTQGAQHLRGEGLVDLVDVEVLQAQAVALEHLRHGHGRRHQQAFAVHEIHRRHLRIAQIGHRHVAMRLRPFFRGQQHRGGAVGQRGRVGRGQGAAAADLVEGRLQRGQLLQRGIRAQDVVALHAAERRDQVGEEAALVGGGQLVVRGHRPGVLRIARDVPLLGHVLAVVAHALAGARLGHARELGLELGELEAAGQRAQLVAGALGAVGRQQPRAQLLAVDDRHLGGGVRTAADARLDLPQRDLVGDGDDAVQAGAAGALQGDARSQRRQPGGQRRLAAQVPVAGMLDHRAHRHFAQLLPVQPVTLDQRAQRAHRHAEVPDIRIRRVLPAKRNADAAENGDGTGCWHGITSREGSRGHGLHGSAGIMKRV